MDANADAVVVEESNNNNTIMSAMATLSSTKLLQLSHLLSTETHRRNQRLAALLSSPTLFSLTLRRLHSLSLSQKTNLLARHLLSSLLPLTHFLYHKPSPSPPPPTPLLSLRDNDAVSLLLLLCEVCHHHPSTLLSPPSSWLSLLRRYFSTSLLSLSLSHYHLSPLPSFTSSLHRLALCRRLLSSGLQLEKAATAAAAATVVGLPSVEGRGGECVVCREEMGGGREVCQLPCGHMFHWSCILPWLEKTNTCPFCRFSLPTDDVFAEIRRLWDSLLAAGSPKTTVSAHCG